MSGLHPIHGHEELREALARVHHRDGLPSPLLLHGPRGVGKQRLAHWVGQMVLCESPRAESPCEACKSCRLHLRLEHPDFHWYLPLSRPAVSGGPDRLDEALEDARRNRLDELRSSPLAGPDPGEPRALHLGTIRNLRKRARQRPSMGADQVFTVAEAELLVAQESSPEAANALLKVLEEPPEGTRFILTSNNPGRLLPTVRSRSVAVHVPPLAAEEVRRFLTGVAGVSEDDAARATQLGQGSIGRAVGFLPREEGEDPILDSLRREAFRIVRASLAPRPGEPFALALGYAPSGARTADDLLSFVEGWLRDLAAVAAGAPEAIINADAGNALEDLLEGTQVDPRALAEAAQVVSAARSLAAGNVNPQLFVFGLLQDLREVAASPVRGEGAVA